MKDARISRFSSLTLQRFFHSKVQGFSLVEISIVLLIMGVLAGAMMKGKDLIESARLRAVASDIQHLRMAYANYVNSYGSIPGNDSAAVSKFGDSVSNGSGDGKLTGDEAKFVFKHLDAAGLIDSPIFKMPKIGGEYSIIVEDGITKIQLADNASGFLTHQQAVSLASKITEISGEPTDKIEIMPKEIKQNSKYFIKVKID